MTNIKKSFQFLKSNFYILLFLFIALFPKINVVNIGNKTVGIRIEDFIILFYFIYLVYKLIKNKKNINNYEKLKKLTTIFGVYLFFCTISTIYGFFKGYISILYGILYTARKLEYFVFVFIGYDYIYSKDEGKDKTKNTFFRVINITVIIHFIICMMQVLGIFGSINKNGEFTVLFQSRVCSTFNGAYEMTAFLLIIVPIYLYNIFKEKRNILPNVIYTLLISIMIFISESRTSLVVLLFIIVAMAIVYNKKYITKIIIVIECVFLIFALLILIFGMNGKTGISRIADINIKEIVNATKYAFENRNFEYYVSTGNWFYLQDFYYDKELKQTIMAVECDPSYFVRISHWSQLIDGFLKSPIIGTGISISQSAADGNYIRILAESGIIGFAIWIILQIYIFKLIKNKGILNATIKFGLITLFLGAIFIDVFEASKVMMIFYFVLGFAIAYESKEDKDKKVKNVVVINDFNYVEGGASKVAIETAKSLKDEGKNVYFFCAVSKEEDKVDGVTYISTNQKEALKTKNRFIGIINGIYNVKAKLMLKKLLNNLDDRETVIHIHGWTKALSSSVFKSAFDSSIKTIVTTHDYFTACPNGGYFNYKKNKICDFKGQSLKCACSNCDSRNYIFKIYRLIRQFIQNQFVCINDNIKYVITISDKNTDILKRTLNKDAVIRKIANPISIEDIESRIEVENNNEYIYIGRLSKEKGVDIFCETVSKYNLDSVVIGDGSEFDRLKSKYKNTTIKFTGWLDKENISKYLIKARMLIFPSLWYEGAPLTPLEVMNYGIPCVISNCCSATEYIENKNGEIFDPYVENDLISKIDKINSDIIEYSVNCFEYVNKLKSRKYVTELIKFMEEN